MMLKLVMLVLVTSVVASAFVCTENICAVVRCMSVESCPPGERIEKNGGYCQCCDSCVKIQNEGARSSDDWPEGK